MPRSDRRRELIMLTFAATPYGSGSAIARRRSKMYMRLDRGIRDPISRLTAVDSVHLPSGYPPLA